MMNVRPICSRAGAVAFAALCLLNPMVVRGQERSSDKPSITVTGHGEVNVKPDMVEIEIGVTTQNRDAGVAVRENSEKMERLFADLKSHGIAEKDLRTSNFSVSQLHHQDRNNRPAEISYQVNNLVHVRVHEIGRLGQILDELTQSGANQIGGIQFGVNETSRLQDDARRLAVKDALRKAKLYADATGVAVGQPLHISEQGNMRPYPMPQMRMSAMADAASVPIASGESTIASDVHITYELVAV